MAVTYNGIERYIFADTYNLFLKYKDIPNEDYYWEKLAEEANIITFKYKNHPLAKSLVMQVILQLEHKLTDKPREGLTHTQWEYSLPLAHKMGW